MVELGRGSKGFYFVLINGHNRIHNGHSCQDIVMTLMKSCAAAMSRGGTRLKSVPFSHAARPSGDSSFNIAIRVDEGD